MNYETAAGWKYNLRLGPMTRAEWFQIIYHEREIFERTADGSGETLKKYQDAFPDPFLCVDIDCYRVDQPAAKAGVFLDSVRRKSHDLVTKLIDFCKRPLS